MTIRDSRADLVINDSLGKVFSLNYGYVEQIPWVGYICIEIKRNNI